LSGAFGGGKSPASGQWFFSPLRGFRFPQLGKSKFPNTLGLKQPRFEGFPRCPPAVGRPAGPRGEIFSGKVRIPPAGISRKLVRPPKPGRLLKKAC